MSEMQECPYLKSRDVYKRQITITANKLVDEKSVKQEDEYQQLDLFTDYEAQDVYKRQGSTPSRINNEYWENGTISWVKSGEVHNNITLQTEE